MIKNNKKNLMTILLLLIIILLILLVFIELIFLSKKHFSEKNNGNIFSKIENRKEDKSNIPSKLKWQDSFKEKSKDNNEKPQGSYFQYLAEKNKQNKQK